MTDDEALAKLRAQGHAASVPDGDGWVRVWIHGGNEAIDVKAGRELHELAEGKLSFDDIRDTREDETLIDR